MMKKLSTLSLLIVATAVLTACGGGGGGADSGNGSTGGNNGGGNGSTGGSSSTIPAGTTLATPNYAAGTATAQVFQALNAYRQQCGFPAYQQNTILDQSAQKHADYQVLNGGVVTDTEVAGNPGFTGVTGQDRANVLGWPSSVDAGAADAGFYTNATLTQSEYGQKFVDAWNTGVYHQVVTAFPAALLGVGVSQTTYAGFPQVLASVQIGKSGSVIPSANSPLTFPCQGVTGVPASGAGESPTPPNTSGPWGTPVTVVGNPSDLVNLTSATMTPQGGAALSLNILTSANDTTGLIGKYQAVAYSSTPLQSNTVYSVSLTGTINGVPYSRNFTFTTK